MYTLLTKNINFSKYFSQLNKYNINKLSWKHLSNKFANTKIYKSVHSIRRHTLFPTENSVIV